MWKIDFEQDRFDEMEKGLSKAQLVILHATIAVFESMSLHPLEFDGVKDVTVGHDARDDYPSLYKAHLRIPGEDELIIVFGVFEEPFIRQRVVYSGTLCFLEYGVLKSLRDKSSIENSLEKQAFFKMLGYIERGHKWL